MNILTILLQVPANATVSAPVSNTKLIIFWVVVALCVATFFYFLRRTDRLIDERNNAGKQEHIPVPVKGAKHGDVHEEEAAAIALAMHLYRGQLHDMESLTITMQKVSRMYSPWSSKIYTLRQNPRIK